MFLFVFYEFMNVRAKSYLKLMQNWSEHRMPTDNTEEFIW